MKKVFVALSIIIGTICVFAWVVMYGMNSIPCTYTNRHVDVLPELYIKLYPRIADLPHPIGTYVTAKEDINILRGNDTRYKCFLQPESVIVTELIESGAVKSYQISSERGSRTFDVLSKETRLKVIDIMEYTPHGLVTIGGNQPFHFLILQDTRGEKYKISVGDWIELRDFKKLINDTELTYLKNISEYVVCDTKTPGKCEYLLDQDEQ
jgi:hypothetical protein